MGARLRGSGIGAVFGEARPLVYQGVVYVITGADDVFAISVDSGEILWSYEAKLRRGDRVLRLDEPRRGIRRRQGVRGQLDGKLVALDQRTGKVEWSVQAERWQEGLSITSAPLYYDGLVFMGVAGAEYGVRGRV